MILVFLIVGVLSLSAAIEVKVTPTSNEVTISWTNGVAYLYRPILKKDSTVIGNPIRPATAVSFTFKDLIPNTEYTISLETWNLKGENAIVYPETNFRTTVEAPKRPQIPRNLKCQTVSNTSFTLTWQTPINAGQQVQYDVQHGLFGGRLNTSTVSDTTITLSDLTPGRYYAVYVSAVSDSLKSIPATIGPIFTQEVPIVPMKVDLLAEMTYTLSWNFESPETPPNCPLYLTYLRVAGNTTEGYFNLPPTAKTYEMILDPFSTYEITAVGVCIGRYGIYARLSSPIKTPPKAPSVPHGLRSSSVKETSFTITWLPPSNPNGVITAYIVTLNGASQPNTSTILQRTFDNLTPLTTYAVSVQAQNDLIGPAVKIRVVTLPRGAIQKPVAPVLSSVVSFVREGANITWSSVSGALGYRLSYWPKLSPSDGFSVDTIFHAYTVLTNLKNGLSYEAQVLSSTLFATTDPSNKIQFTYNSLVPSLPENLKVKVANVGLIRATWDVPATRATTEVNVAVYLGPSLVNQSYVNIAAGGLDVEGLPPQSVLSAVVWATSGLYNSSQMLVDGLMMPENAPDVPIDVVVSSQGPTNISAEWKLPEDGAYIKYMMLSVIDNATSQAVSSKQFDKSVLSTTIDGLLPFIVYRVDLQTFSYPNQLSVSGLSSEVVVVMTQTWPTGPAEVVVPDNPLKLDGEGTVIANWNAPDALRGEVEQYNVTARDGNIIIVSQMVPPDILSARLTGLPGGLTVHVFVVTSVQSALGNVGAYNSSERLLGKIVIPPYVEGISGGAIAGIVIAIIVVLVIVAFLIVRRLTKSRADQPFVWSEYGDDHIANSDEMLMEVILPDPEVYTKTATTKPAVDSAYGVSPREQVF